MKNGTTIFFFMLALSNVWAQSTLRGTENATGANPLKSDDKGNTRALVIGISDYVDDDIADLKYAHRDAQIFADYLLAANGAALPKENLKLLLNESATLATIDMGLDWLLQETKKGDKVIIYFSGHGDVEKQTPWQRGFLLAHDTPFPNLRNNATRVEDLDEIVKTLSVSKESKVIVILDACRAGKLANTGPSLTAEQLERQVENEVRILSCKPDQKSLEGENWGQGRGLFSFFLVNGLSGLADAGSFPDQIITLDELTGFVKNGMQQALSDPSFNNRQNPVFVGDENYEVAEVTPLLLSSLATTDAMAMTSASPKGMTEKGADSSAVEVFSEVAVEEVDWLYQFADFSLFDDFVVESSFPALIALPQSDSLLRFFIQKISGDVRTDSLDEHEKTSLLQAAEAALQSPSQGQRLQLLLATELHDQAQSAINDYLRGDPGSLDKRYFKDQAEKYVIYPRMLEAALVLLPKGHILRKKAEVKLHYFDGVCTRLAGQMSDDPKPLWKEAFSKQQKALKLDDKAAYVHNELGLLYFAMNEVDSAISFFQNAVNLAPAWALPQSNLCGAYLFKKKFELAIKAGETAVSLQPDYFGGYLNLGMVAEQQHDLLKAETLYRKSRSLNDPHYLPYERQAYLQLESGRYEEANWNFHEMELRKKGAISDLPYTTIVDVPVLASPLILNYPELSGRGVKHPNPKTAQDFFMTGKAFFEERDDVEAEMNFKAAMRLDPKHLEVYYYLGTICLSANRFEEAEVYFKRLIPLRPEVGFLPIYLAEVYSAWERPIEEEAIYKSLIDKGIELVKTYDSYSDLLMKQKRYQDLENLLWKGIHSGEVEYWATKNLGVFYNNMVNKFPNNADWLYRMAIFNYHYVSHGYGVDRLLKVLEIDTTFAARPYIHALAGAYYLHEGRGKFFRSNDPDWGDLPAAIQQLRQAVSLAPTLPSAKYDLSQACVEMFEYEEALAVLQALRDSNDLNFESRLRLADLLLRSGRFSEANKMLQIAWDIQPEAVRGLPVLSGKLLQLQGKHADAIALYRQEYELAIADNLNSQRSNNQPNKAVMGNEVIEFFGLRGSDVEYYDVATATAYTLARLYAWSNKKAEAMKWLQEALNKGFDSKLVMKYDPAFKDLRADAAFQKMMQ